MPAETPFVKPSSPVIKRLFDFSDPNETKKMLDEMLKLENDRLKSVYNFDSRAVFPAAINDQNSRNINLEIPMSKKRFVNWERQERRNVPHYYTRPLHPHRSESRNLNLTTQRSGTTLKTLSENEDHFNPLPLASRNANLMKHCIRKRTGSKPTPVFTSPPRITSGNVNPSLVQFVTALRVPLPSIKAQNPAAGSENRLVEETTSPKRLHSISAGDPLKNQASRQLFDEKTSRKRSQGLISSRQPKITDLVPLRKARLNCSKRLRSELTEQVPVSVDQQ